MWLSYSIFLATPVEWINLELFPQLLRESDMARVVKTCLAENHNSVLLRNLYKLKLY